MSISLSHLLFFSPFFLPGTTFSNVYRVAFADLALDVRAVGHYERINVCLSIYVNHIIDAQVLVFLFCCLAM